jgi:hypothetical protein
MAHASHIHSAIQVEGTGELRVLAMPKMEVWRGIEDSLDAGELPGIEQDTLLRLALNHATWTVQDVGQTVHRWAGTAAIRRGPIDRFLRDLGTGTQHITSSLTVLQNCGKWLSGAQPQGHWEFLDLTP